MHVGNHLHKRPTSLKRVTDSGDKHVAHSREACCTRRHGDLACTIVAVIDIRNQRQHEYRPTQHFPNEPGWRCEGTPEFGIFSGVRGHRSPVLTLRTGKADGLAINLSCIAASSSI